MRTARNGFNDYRGGTVRYFIFVAETIFCQIFIVLILMRKTKKKIIKIGALLTKWEQFPYGKSAIFVDELPSPVTGNVDNPSGTIY